MALTDIGYEAPEGTIGIVIPVSGEIRVENPQYPKKGYLLGQIHTAISGYYETIRTDLEIKGMKSPLIMLVNDEARVMGNFEVNPTASLIAGQPIYGDVLVTNVKMVK